MNNSYFGRIFNSYLFQYVILFVIALITWQIFYPGLLSPDSLDQYAQAKSGIYNDWHPPLMAMVLRVIMKIGGDIGTLIFLQCLAAVFGMRNLVAILLRVFSENGITKTASRLIATLLTILLLIPFLSPFLFYSVTFWTDAWLSITLLWVVSYILWLFANQSILSVRQVVINVILFSISSALMVLIRHNSLVMMPAICLILAILCYLKLGKKGLVMAALPVILVLILNFLIYGLFTVSRTYTGTVVLASDLTVMLKLFPDLDSKYPLAFRHKESPTVLLADGGGLWNETTEGKPCPVLNKEICNPEMPLACFGFKTNTLNIEGNDCYMLVGHDNKTLKDEYFKAATNNPIQLLTAKFYLFKVMLRSDYWVSSRVSCEISNNDLGLKLNDTFTGTRDEMCYMNEQFANNWCFYWFFGVHLLWLILNILFVLYYALKFALKRDSRSIFSLLLFLIPLSYFLAYIVASTTPDYRFMYPSTLLMQALTVSFVVSKLMNLFRTERRNVE